MLTWRQVRVWHIIERRKCVELTLCNPALVPMIVARRHLEQRAHRRPR
jgi:hypothetical protein